MSATTSQGYIPSPNPAIELNELETLTRNIQEARNSHLETIGLYAYGAYRPNLGASIHDCDVDISIGKLDPVFQAIDREFKIFLEKVLQEVTLRMQLIHINHKLIKYGNHIVTLDDFIKEYSTEPFPVLDAAVIAELQAAKLGEEIPVMINGEYSTIKRLS